MEDEKGEIILYKDELTIAQIEDLNSDQAYMNASPGKELKLVLR